MCDMCEGKTFEQHLDRVRRMAEQTGWALQAVGGEPVGWVYTVGLIDRFDHPELLTIDTEVSRAAQVLNELGARVRDGARLSPGPVVLDDGTEVELVEVHPVHTMGDLIATWHNLHAHQPDDERPIVEVLQVLVPEVVTAGPRAVRQRLDAPFARLP